MPLEEQTLVSKQDKYIVELKYLQKRISSVGLLSQLSDRTSAVGLLCDGVCGERTGGTFHTLGAAWWGGWQTEVTWLLAEVLLWTGFSDQSRIIPAPYTPTSVLPNAVSPPLSPPNITSATPPPRNTTTTPTTPTPKPQKAPDLS